MAGLAARTSAWAPAPSSCVGPSTCDRFTSALGAGQRVLSYTYYTPWGAKGGRTKQNSRPNDRSSVRYTELLTTLATTTCLFTRLESSLVPAGFLTAQFLQKM